MKQDIPIGSVADFEMSLAGGKAIFDLSAGSFGIDLTFSLDSGALISLLFEALEKATPGAAPIEEAVKNVIIDAVRAIQ